MVIGEMSQWKQHGGVIPRRAVGRKEGYPPESLYLPRGLGSDKILAGKGASHQAHQPEF